MYFYAHLFCPQSPFIREIVSLERHFRPAIRMIHIM